MTKILRSCNLCKNPSEVVYSIGDYYVCTECAHTRTIDEIITEFGLAPEDVYDDEICSGNATNEKEK